MGAERFDASIVSGVTPRGRLGDVKRAFIGTFWIQAESKPRLDRQQAKLLPVEYFMVTFTLPYELRALAWRHQTTLYKLLFATAAGTLKDFGLNPKQLGVDLGMTAVLHTHSRRLDYHPHLHVIVPGGGVNKITRQWKKTRGKYLFNQAALAKVFRARLLAAIKAVGLALPAKLPDPLPHAQGRGLPVAGAAACPAQGLSTGPGLWFFAR